MNIDIKEMAFGDHDYELKQTHRLLAVIPTEQLDYRPHAKAWRLGDLAEHVAQLPILLREVARSDELDFAKVPKREPRTRSEDILADFDRNADEARAALADLKPEDLTNPWTFRFGDRVFFTRPKGALLRSFALSHMIHHRAQLTVYLRILGLKVPGMYGPTADET